MFLWILFVNFVFCFYCVSSAIIPSNTTKIQSLPDTESKILNELPLRLKVALLKKQFNDSNPANCANGICSTSAGGDKTRLVGVQELRLMSGTRRQDLAGVEAEDNNMKMKLFRLMYETVRDSDTKVKRAELIKKNYGNSSSFELGFLIGDITDKYNIMMDISLTLKRLYHEWKPIEHINAYEQIANMAIDIGHIAELIRGFEKKIFYEETQPIQPPPPPVFRQGNANPGYFQIH